MLGRPKKKVKQEDPSKKKVKQEDPSLSAFVGLVKQENPQQLPPNIPGGLDLPWWQPSPAGGPVASVPNPHLPLILHSSEPAELPPLPAFLGSVVIPPPLSMEQLELPVLERPPDLPSDSTKKNAQNKK